MQPLVTIPIAAYSTRPDHLSAAIRSALLQSWPRIEVLVSDDSPDQSLRSVVDSFGDPRVSYRHNSPRLGPSENYWAAFREAKGEFIAVLNHDDLFAPDFLEKLLPPLLSDPRLVLSFCDHWVIDVDGRQLAEKTDQLTKLYGRSSLNEGPVAPFFNLFVAKTIPLAMGTVFRKSELPAKLPATAGPAYDFWLAYLLCRGGRGAYFVPERLSSWRQHAANLTGGQSLGWLQGEAECWATASCDSNLVSILPATSRNAALAYFACAKSAWRSGHRVSILRFAMLSLRARPSFRGVLAFLLPIVPRRLDWVGLVSPSQAKAPTPRIGLVESSGVAAPPRIEE